VQQATPEFYLDSSVRFGNHVWNVGLEGGKRVLGLPRSLAPFTDKK
jgi:hypothetical protein